MSYEQRPSRRVERRGGNFANDMFSHWQGQGQAEISC
jgi:hypothetical protein